MRHVVHCGDSSGRAIPQPTGFPFFYYYELCVIQVALSARLREGQLKVVDDLTCDTFSTSAMLKTMEVRLWCTE